MVFDRVVGKSETTIFSIISVEYYAVHTFFHKDTIVGKRFFAVEVEDKQQVATAESHKLVAFVVPHLFDSRFAEALFFANEVHHVFIKLVEVAVVELFAVDE